MTHISVSKRTIIGSDNGLSPGRRQAIIWINVEILLIGNLNRNSYIFIQENASENVVWKMAAICLGLNVLSKCCSKGVNRGVLFTSTLAMRMLFLPHEISRPTGPSCRPNIFSKSISDRKNCWLETGVECYIQWNIQWATLIAHM